MSVFNPEFREERESLFEAKKFGPDLRKKLLSALDAGKDRFPDIIQCPNDSCSNPLTIHMHPDIVHAVCTNCGWEQVLKSSI